MITYRHGGIDDAGAYVAHMNRAGGESDFLAFEGGAFYLDEAGARAAIDGYLRADNQAFFVAEQENRIVGIAILEGASMPRLVHSAELRIAVARACWGQGVARGLMALVRDYFDASSVLTRMSLQVSAHHARGIALYRRFGFVEEGLKRRGIRIGDGYHDLLMMAHLKA